MAEPDWERHTKGIGSKLLQKFGFTGRLGAKENGVSTSIEVVVRPNAAGLGYGDIVEASSLKNNKKLEAEWRGLEYVEDEKGDTEEEKVGSRGSRAKRGMGDAMGDEVKANQSWKKSNKSAGKGGAKVLTAADFLAATSGSEVRLGSGAVAAAYSIIDMRGAEARVVTDLTDLGGAAGLGKFRQHGAGVSSVEEKEAALRIGEEIIHNVSVLVDLSQAAVEEQSRAVRQCERRAEHLGVSRDNLTLSIDADSLKLVTLDRLVSVLQRVRSKQQEGDVALTDMLTLFRTLHANFRAEFHTFGLLSLLHPMTIPIIEKTVVGPLLIDPLVDSSALVGVSQPWADLASYFGECGDYLLGRQVQACLCEVFKVRALPAITRVITNEWTPTAGGAGCADLIERLSSVCADDTCSHILEGIVLPKLMAAVSSWNPGRSSSVHTWLHPWLPLLKSRLSEAYPDIRRKISSYLSRWHPSDASGLDLIRPWVGVFDESSLEQLLLRSVLPRLLSVLRDECVINPAAQDLTPVDWVVSWEGVLPQRHFTSMFVGEFFPVWLKALAAWLEESKPHEAAVRGWYSGWRAVFPDSFYGCRAINRLLSAALDTIAVYLVSSKRRIEYGTAVFSRFVAEVLRGCPQSYFTAIDTLKEEEDAVAAASSAGAGHRGIGVGIARATVSMSFRESLEEYAFANNIDFVAISGERHDDKQLYQFGAAVIYTERSLIYMKTLNSGSHSFELATIEALVKNCREIV